MTVAFVVKFAWRPAGEGINEGTSEGVSEGTNGGVNGGISGGTDGGLTKVINRHISEKELPELQKWIEERDKCRKEIRAYKKRMAYLEKLLSRGTSALTSLQNVNTLKP